MSMCKPGGGGRFGEFAVMWTCQRQRGGERRGGEQPDNDWSVSAQQQQAHRFQGSLRRQLVVSVNT